MQARSLFSAAGDWILGHLTVPEGAGFIGLWSGTWSGIWPNSLVIAPGPRDGDLVIDYVWGDGPFMTPGHARHHVRQEGNAFHIRMPRVEMAFRLLRPDTIHAWRQPKDGARATITLRKVIPDDPVSDILRERIRIPTVPGAAYGETTPTLYVTLYRPKDGRPRPLALYNHGSSDGLGPIVTTLFEGQARALIDRGYAVAVPMRRGRGRSDGPLAETQALWDRTPEGLQPEADKGLDDLDAVVAHLAAKPWVDAAAPMLVGGQSRGGFLSLAFAARHGDRVGAVLNHAGGWWGADHPRADYQFTVLEDYGRAVTAPSLWIYGTEDPYYSPLSFIEPQHAAFARGNGRSRLLLLDGEGHGVQEQIHLWEAALDQMLRG